jgi:hypothetical protein
MHAFLREDYLNQVQRVFLTHALRAGPRAKNWHYFDVKIIYMQAMRQVGMATAMSA